MKKDLVVIGGDEECMIDQYIVYINTQKRGLVG